MTLQELLEQESAIENALDQVMDDDTMPILIGALDNIHEDKNAKIDNYVGFIHSLDAREDAITKEIKRLQDRKKVTGNLKDRAKARLCYTLQVNGIDKINTDFHTVTVTTSGTRPLIQDDTVDVPEEWMIATWKPDNAKIKDALIAGQEVPGFSLGEPVTSVRIK